MAHNVYVIYVGFGFFSANNRISAIILVANFYSFNYDIVMIECLYHKREDIMKMDTETFLFAKNLDLDKLNIYQFNEDTQSVINSYVEITRHLQELGQLFHVFRFNLESLLNILFNNVIIYFSPFIYFYNRNP